jgi:hypothetical protein
VKRDIAKFAILFNKMNKIRLRYPILATRAVKLVLQHNEPVGKVCCRWERLHPECLVLWISGTEQVVVLHPIFTRWQALNSTNSQLAQLASIDQARIERNVIQAKLFYCMDLPAYLLSCLPKLAEDDKHPVTKVHWRNFKLIPGRNAS